MSRFTQVKENANVTSSFVGPLKWMAPEAITNRGTVPFHNYLNIAEYSEKTDVWSYGVTICELVTQEDPYPGYDMVPYIIFYNYLTNIASSCCFSSQRRIKAASSS